MYLTICSKAKHARKRKLSDASERLDDAVKRLKVAKERLIEAKVKFFTFLHSCFILLVNNIEYN